MEAMHSYLRAIGFSHVKNRKELDKIIGIVMDRPLEKKSYKLEDKLTLTELSKDFSERMGVTVRGEYDEKGFFHLEHYFPYLKGQNVSVKEEVIVNKKVDTNAYMAMCDDLRLGVSLIFYLQNSIDFMKAKKGQDDFSQVVPVTLSGLSVEGKILLGTKTDEDQMKHRTLQAKQRNQLIAEARKGNQDAIDSLTIEDIDLYTAVSRRARYEDVYSIVENTFIPYGSESDNYSIIGTITGWNITTNSITGEEVYDLLITCNDIIYNVCINKNDLLGQPAVGRRFKGNIWMQGEIDFSEW